jgi:hypothetical protein
LLASPEMVGFDLGAGRGGMRDAAAAEMVELNGFGGSCAVWSAARQGKQDTVLFIITAVGDFFKLCLIIYFIKKLNILFYQ